MAAQNTLCTCEGYQAISENQAISKIQFKFEAAGYVYNCL